MKKYIYNFDQEFVMKIYNDNERITTDDILILNYILDMLCSETCEHIHQNNNLYVWINRDKLLEDLPILDINKRRLSGILNKLESLQLINRVKTTRRNQGSRTYVAVTELTLSALESSYLEKLKKQLESFRSAKNCTSDNIINNILITIDKYLNNNIYNTNIRSAKNCTSNNLFTQCVSEIDKYTSDQELKDKLVEYLKVRLSIKDKPFKSYHFANQLKTLDALTGDKITIINQSIERRWAKFVEPQKYKYNTFEDRKLHVFGEPEYVKSVPYSEEEKENIRKWQEENHVESF